MQSFWTWADCGAFLLIDEAQSFWPSEMRPSDWAPFALPGGVDSARIQGRPRDYADAWTRHRHFNWDIVLTTPDIKLFHTKIRSVSEAAYLHKNQALIGLKGRFLEGMHLASNNGSDSDIMTIRQRKIPKWVFQLYQSTSTGVVSDTKAGLPIWKNPKIMGLLLFLVVIVALLVSRGDPRKIFQSKTAPSVSSSDSNSSHPDDPTSSNSTFRSRSDPFVDLIGKSLWLVGASSYWLNPLHSNHVIYFELQGPDEIQGSIMTSDTFINLGYAVTRINRNLVLLEKDGVKYFARSRGIKSEKKICFSLIVLLFSTSTIWARTIDFSFYDAPIRDVAVLVSELTNKSISGSFGDRRMTLVAEGLELSEVIPIFSSSLSSIGLTLVKTDWGYVVRPVEQGIDPGNGWAVFSLSYASATDIKTALESAIGTSGQVSAVGEYHVLITGPADQVKRYQSIVSALDSPRAADVERIPLKHVRVSQAIDFLQAEGSSLKLIPDYWGHAVIVQGPLKERELVRATLGMFDQPSPDLQTRVIPLHTQDPEQILSIVQGLFDGISAHIAGNSLLLSGPAELVASADRMITELDGSSEQVRVECVIASLTDQEFEELGIRLATSGNISANLNAAGIQSLLVPGPGLLIDLVSGSLSGSIAAVETRSRGEVLSSPVVSALSGHSARIVVGQNVPFIDKQTKTQSGESEYSVTREDVGVSLAITPKVEGDFIYLTVEQEVSSIDPSKTSAIDLITEKRSIESTVKLADGESIFLGGVKSSERGSTREYVPILGWIPLVGEIFTYRKTTETNRNLVISLRPTIIRQKI